MSIVIDFIIDYYTYFIAGFFFYVANRYKALMDYSSAGDFVNREYYKNKSASWANKYFFPLLPYKPKWYYGAFSFTIFNKTFSYKGLITPRYKERFMWSTTILVFLTDYWHKVQFFYLNCSLIGTCLVVDNIYKAFALFLALKVLNSASFNIGFENKRKTK